MGLLVRDRVKAARFLELGSNVHFFDGDLQHNMSIVNALNDFKPHTLIHLGWSGVAGGERDGVLQLANLDVTVRLLQSAIQAGIETFVGLGSQAEYGFKSGSISETESCEPLSLYGACKLASCCVTQQMCRISDVRFAWIRLFSCYGPFDKASFMIPSVIESLLRGERPALTAAEQIWDYLFVNDAAVAIDVVAKCASANGIFNLGSGKGVAVRAVVEQIRDLIDVRLPLGFGELAYGENQVMHLQASISRLENLGWRPTTPLIDGLEVTIDWHRKSR